MNYKELKSYFKTALGLADTGKVKRLFASLGYLNYQQITPEMCIEALNAHGFDFSQPFGYLAQSGLKNPRVERYISAYGLDRLTGVTVPAANTAPGVTPIASVGTTTNSTASGLNIFNSITGFLIGGVKSASDLINTLKGRDLLLAEAALEQQRAATASNTKKTNWLAIFGIGGAIVLIVIVVFVLKGKK